MRLFRKFAAEETGAVTVDWVVLTAGVVALGALALGAVKGGVSRLSGDVSTYMAGINPG